MGMGMGMGKAGWSWIRDQADNFGFGFGAASIISSRRMPSAICYLSPVTCQLQCGLCHLRSFDDLVIKVGRDVNAGILCPPSRFRSLSISFSFSFSFSTSFFTSFSFLLSPFFRFPVFLSFLVLDIILDLPACCLDRFREPKIDDRDYDRFENSRESRFES